eukprot:jgi/Chlat1/1243/Chrsp115S01689
MAQVVGMSAVVAPRSLPAGLRVTATRSGQAGAPCAQAAPRRRVAAVPPRSSFLRSSLQSSFFDGGNAFSAVTQQATSCSYSESTDGAHQYGGPLTTQMNLFSRVVRVVKSYANAIVSAAEDPEKILEQTVQEMNEDLIKMRQASAQVMASSKQLENKYKQAAATADDWYRRAQLAIQKGDDELAKEALKRRKSYLENAESLKSQLTAQQGAVEKLISSTRMLESKMAEARSKKDTLKARAQSAKTSQKVQEMVGNMNSSNALAAFDRMEEKVLAMEAEAESVAQLTTDDLSSKFLLLESNDVEDELAKMKKGMLADTSSKKTPELPPGRPVPSAIDQELEELRRKTREL